MNGYNFTDRVRTVLQLAREEAARLHHEYVGTEHLLLGLIREGDGVAAAVLTNLNVDLSETKQKIEENVKEGQPTASVGPDLPYTSRAKKVIELAMSEARELNHSYVGTEHLLLGLLREEKGIAAQVLTHYAGVTLETARAETLRLLGGEVRPPAPQGGSAPPWSPRGGSKDAKPIRRSRLLIALQSSWFRVLAGVVTMGSGIEALRYAPGVPGKIVGALSVGCSLLLMMGFWRSRFWR